MQQGFFKSLFDLSFTSLITTKIIKVLYVLAMIGIAFYALIFTVAAFQASSALGLLVLVVGAPLFALAALIYARVLLEVFIALFRIMENTSELVATLRPNVAAPPTILPPGTPPAPMAPPAAPSW